MALVRLADAQKNPNPGGSSYTWSVNAGTGNDRALFVSCTMANTVNFGTVTYNGVAMTLVKNSNRGGLSQRMGVWYLANPATGSNNLVLNFSGGQWNPISLYAQPFSGAETTIGNFGTTGGLTTPNIQSITHSEGSFVYLTACSINALTNLEVPQGSVRPAEYTHNTNRQVSGSWGLITTSAATINVESNSTYGSVTCDRFEVKAKVTAPPATRRIFIVT